MSRSVIKILNASNTALQLTRDGIQEGKCGCTILLSHKIIKFNLLNMLDNITLTLTLTPTLVLTLVLTLTLAQH